MFPSRLPKGKTRVVVCVLYGVRKTEKSQACLEISVLLTLFPIRASLGHEGHISVLDDPFDSTPHTFLLLSPVGFFPLQLTAG